MATSKFVVVLGIVLAGALPLVAGGWSYDQNFRYESDDERFDLDIVNLFQSRVSSSNPEQGESGLSFDVNHLRVRFEGQAFEHWGFLLQTDLATGSLSDDESESNLLLDALVKFKKRRMAQLWIGQGKVAFGRQQLVDVGQLTFTNRSIVTERFVPGRDVGIALVGEPESGKYGYSVGIHNGNGINEAQDENKDYMATARLVVMPMGPMPLMESDPDWSRRPETRMAVGVALLTNQMGEGSFEEERINGGTLEYSVRVRGFFASAEFFTESRKTLMGATFEEADTDGWHAQAGYAFPVTELGVIEIAGRAAEILRDVADADQSEQGVALNFYFKGQRHKLQLDFRNLQFEGLAFGTNIDRKEMRAQVQLTF